MLSFRRRFRFKALWRADSPSAQQQDSQFQIRLVVAFAAMVFAFFLLFTRFVFLQVLQHDHFSTLAQQNRISLVPVEPNRGLIVDRNGEILAQNYSAYTLELTPSKIDDLDATIAEVGKLVEVTPRDLRRFRKLLGESRNFESVPLKVKLTDVEIARIAAQRYRLPGVDINARLFRDYPFKNLLSHVIGYIGRINQKDQDMLEETEQISNYRGSTHIGKTGLEKVYEEELHGVTGFEEVETDAGGRAIRTLRRTPPRNGKILKLALDIRLQQKASQLFAGRRGALVAIDPATGGVLAFLSEPGFDPNLFIDGIDSQTWKDLNDDWKKPLVNRALRGLYPPGSTFKPFMAMSNLEAGFRSPDYAIADPGYFTLPGSSHRFRDSFPSGRGSVNLFKAIQVSSDTYFYKLAWDMGIDRLAPQLAKFGLGTQTGIDLDHEARGVLPSREWKARRFARYPENVRRWMPADVVPIGIGQGYNTYTPLQMANATAILANGGKVFKPHVVQEIIDPATHAPTRVSALPIRDNHFNPKNVNFVKEAMAAVLKPGGTGARIGAGLQYDMAGKTGTAQVVQIKQGAKYNAAALAEQHRDHSWFIAFAPVDQPKIAVAVIVENGGWGAAAAAPIVRQLVDFYLLDNGKTPLIHPGDEVPAPDAEAAAATPAKPSRKPGAPAGKPAAAPPRGVEEVPEE
ncbi:MULTISPECIES: penicillin-binding protein 2 [Microvirgula]|uniref:penicillin-binding protein 2 n=1 Tax=Microvirgula TaxID=57479 RepID=UPI000685FE2E|nr:MULTISPECIES: penicillin-binding protein 2 [Microvirgula]RAS20058.1 penicillin-binding protein 2 [Microvirgula sp. AG722]